MSHWTREPYKLLIVGPSGVGKSTYLDRFIKRVKCDYRFVFDLKGEWGSRFGLPAARSERELLAQLPTGWIIFDPNLWFAGDHTAAFAWFADFTYCAAAKLPGRKFWVPDELQDFVTKNSFPKEARQIFEKGRSHGLDVAAIAQSANQLNCALRGQLTEIVVFSTFERRALEWLADVGVPASVRDLKPGEYYARDLRTRGEARGRVF